MEKTKNNKSWEPEEAEVQNVPEAMVKIRFRPNRAAEGVEMDAEGCAFVAAKTAEYLVSIGYAEYVQ